MPIANCFVSDTDLSRCDLDDVVRLWSEQAGIAADEMTVNVVATDGQGGRRYRVMAHLDLPSLWSEADVARLQLGLARALSRGLGVELAEVHVITSIVSSGHVVEAGEIQEW